MREKARKIVVWSAVSWLLAKNETSIRGNRIPFKYREAIDDLLRVIDEWIEKWSK